jgi:hypothetical protein
MKFLIYWMIAIGVYGAFVNNGSQWDTSLDNAIFWPITLPYMITNGYLQDHNTNSPNTNR